MQQQKQNTNAEQNNNDLSFIMLTNVLGNNFNCFDFILKLIVNYILMILLPYTLLYRLYT
jgi:hypothetical protein